MDKIFQILRQIYRLVDNYPSTNEKGKTTVIRADHSKQEIGLPEKYMKNTIVEVNGDNTIEAVYYGNHEIDMASKYVPDAGPLLERYFQEMINKAKEKESGMATAAFGLNKDEINRIKSAGGIGQRIPNSVKPIAPIKPIAPAKPIKPVRNPNPWKSIRRPKIKIKSEDTQKP
jgi:hypothetical protein